MNRTMLIDRIAGKTGLGKRDVGNFVEAFENVVTKAIQDGIEVRFVGFGTFYRTDLPARTARNPRTGEAIAIGSSRVAKFRPGKSLKAAVNEK